MCTVTYIPLANSVLLTSNRDEKAWRTQAVPPKFYAEKNTQLLFPKDPDAGGTWIAANNKGNTAILLNGSFVKHTPAPPYRKSRGLVLLEIIKKNHPFDYFARIDLSGIEPFTLILFADNNLYECRWNGEKKYTAQKNKALPYIWSSATLYDAAIVQKREAWFREWIKKNPLPSADDILHFHLFGGNGDRHNDLRMNRDGLVYTVSVTGVEINATETLMRYHDMKDDKSYRQSLPCIASSIAKSVPAAS